jgi:hypothetical protein
MVQYGLHDVGRYACAILAIFAVFAISSGSVTGGGEENAKGMRSLSANRKNIFGHRGYSRKANEIQKAQGVVRDVLRKQEANLNLPVPLYH